MSRLMKILALLPILSMTFSLIGCSSTSVGSKSEASAVAKVEKQTNKEEKATEAQDSSAKQTTVKITETETEAALTITDKTVEKAAENKTNTFNTESSKKSNNVSTQKVITSTNKTAATNEKPKTASGTTTVKATTPTKKQTVPQNTVFMTIKGPKDVGTILEKSTIEFKEGDTVLDVLLKAAKENHFLVEYNGTGAMAYIEGIDNIYEFDYGPTSGWNFIQNGTELGKSSGTVKVKKDDKIEWVYTEDFTENK